MSFTHSAPVYEILSKSHRPQHKKIDVMSIFKVADLRHLGFQGVNNGLFEKPMYDCYRSSIETMALNCLVFEKIAFLHFGDGQTNRRTDGQPQRIRLNN